MKRKILINLSILCCVTLLNAHNEVSIEDVDREIKVEQSKAKELDELVITISIKTKDTLAEGDRAIASLQKNLDFINQVATSESFRDCVVAREYKKDVLVKKETAKRMFKEKKISTEQYQEYEQEQNSALETLENKIEKICKEGE